MTFYKFVIVILKPFIKVIFRAKTIGEENIPKTGAVVLCSNHKSNVDPFLVGCVMNRQIYFMAKASLFSIPVIGFLCRKLGAFPVHRGKGDRDAFRSANQILKNGNILALFPEGHRLKVGDTPQMFKTGAARFAFNNKSPILPIAIIVKGSARPFKKTFIKIGKLITYDELGFTVGNDIEIKRVTAEIRQKVIDLLEI